VDLITPPRKKAAASVAVDLTTSVDSGLKGSDNGQEDLMSHTVERQVSQANQVETQANRNVISPTVALQSSQGNQVETTKAQQAHSNIAGGVVIANCDRRFYPLLLHELSLRYGEIRYASWGRVGSHQGHYKGSLVFIVST
jgi:hypothetical protein